MIPLRHTAAVLALLLATVALSATSALAAEGVGPAKKLGGSKTTEATTTTTARPNTGGGKETLTLATSSPTAGATVSGSLVWTISVLSGAPSKVDFAIDGTVVGSDASSPFGASIDTTKLANG